MAVSINTLPDPISDIEIPDTFSVSQVVHFDECVLSALTVPIVLDNDRLRESPSAELGKVYHALMERAVKCASSGEDVSFDDVSDWLDVLLEDVRVRLMNDPITESYADLKVAFLPVVWARKRRAMLDATMAILSSNSNKRSVSSANRQGKFDYRTIKRDGQWSEVPIIVPSLRLKGRIDLVKRLGSQITIVDLKTGQALNNRGEIRAEIVRQVYLYGLMVHKLSPHAEIDIVVNDGREHAIDFDAVVMSSIEEWLQTVLGRLTLGETKNAQSLANVGQSCRWCMIRHRCQAYLQNAPKFWSQDMKWRLPLDIWGTVKQVTDAGNGLYNILMIDAASRHVKLFRIREKYSSMVTIGQQVWFFNLSISRPNYHGKTWRHPLNFHEIGGVSPADRAWSMELFIE